MIGWSHIGALIVDKLCDYQMLVFVIPLLNHDNRGTIQDIHHSPLTGFETRRRNLQHFLDVGPIRVINTGFPVVAGNIPSKTPPIYHIATYANTTHIEIHRNRRRSDNDYNLSFPRSDSLDRLINYLVFALDFARNVARAT